MEDVLVIGGGLMGSAAAWQVIQKGLSVRLIEQQDEKYTYGSSFGEARISRSLGPKNDIFSWLQQASIAETERLLSYLKDDRFRMETLFHTSPVTYIFYPSQQATVDAILEDQTDPIEVALGQMEVDRKFGMQFDEPVTVIREFKPHSGTMHPLRMIACMQEGIRKIGGRISYRHRATSIRRKGEGYEVELLDLENGEKVKVHYKKVITAAGPYTGDLLEHIAPWFKELTSIKRLALAYFKINPSIYAGLRENAYEKIQQAFPVAEFNDELFYAMVEKWEKGAPLFKIGGHLMRKDIEDLDQVWEQALTELEVSWAKSSLQGYLARIGIQIDLQDLSFVKGYSCVYTLSQSEVPFVTPIPDPTGAPDNSIIVIGALSGVGAKGALAYGMLAADQLVGESKGEEMYQIAKKAMGFDRLKEEINGKKPEGNFRLLFE